MKRTRSALLTAVAMVGVLCTQSLTAALSIAGTIPPGGTVVIIPANARGVPAGLLKLKLSSPSNGAHLAFCLGSAPNTCGQAASLVVRVGPGEEQLAVIDAREFSRGFVLVVSQGTASTVGYSVSVE